MVRCREEVRWLFLGSAFPTKVYTDHHALVKLLQIEDGYGRIARWQVRLSEYEVEYIHIPGTQNMIADGLSRLGDCTTGTKVEIYSVDNTGRESGGSKGIEREHDIRLEGWQEWLNENWYAPVIYYRLTGSLDGIPGGNSAMGKSRNVWRVPRSSAQNFLLVLATPATPKN